MGCFNFFASFLLYKKSSKQKNSVFSFTKIMSNNYSFRKYQKKDSELAVQNLINTPYYFEENDAKDFVNEQIESVDLLYCVEVNNNICLIGGYKLEVKKNKEVAYIELLYEFFEYKNLRDYYEVFFVNQIINFIREVRENYEQIFTMVKALNFSVLKPIVQF